jgi:hypothetical protein
MILSTELQYFASVNSIIDIAKIHSVFFQSEQKFRKSTFRNRMLVLGSKGIIQLSIPVVGGRDSKLPYQDILIDYKSDWQKNHFKTLVSLYGNAPWFRHYSHELEEIYNTRKELLFDWNMLCFHWVLKKLKLASEVRIAEILTDKEDLLDKTDFYLPSNYDKTEKGPFLKYTQVFEDKTGFKSNLSCLDLLLNEGPQARNKILSFLAKPL